MTDFLKPGLSRRAVLQTAAVGALGISPALRSMAYAGGSDAPEKTEVKIGFIPLTDCASVVMASELGLDKKYGVKIIPSKESSWASVRDKLISGELDFAHVLYGLVYGVHLGIGGPKKDMAVMMTINNNGQGLSLSKKLADKGAINLETLVALMKKEQREYVFAQTFPWHPRHVAQLLAGVSGCQPCQGREIHRGAPAPDGGQCPCWRHGRLLRR